MLGIYDNRVNERKRINWQFVFLCFISIIFLGVMAFLTLKAKDIHNKLLPHVKQQRFEVIPKNILYGNNKVFIIKTGEKNGEERTFAEIRTVILGEETEEGYKVVSGIDIWDNVIVWSDKELEDGAEVVVIH